MSVPAPVLAHCHLCGEPVDPLDRYTYRGVWGWERKQPLRASGAKGGSDISLRQPLERWAHPRCIDKLRDGTAPGQETLL